MTASRPRTRIPYITLLSVISAVAVVFLHSNGCFWSYSTEPYWKSANIIESLFYFAVPVFFMITGATLIDYPDRYSLKQYFFRRFQKAVIPFLAWSGIGLLYSKLYGTNLLETFSVEQLLKLVFSAKIISYYWFFPSLFCVYLCIPLLVSVNREKRNRIFIYLLTVGLFFNNVVPFLKSVFQWSYKFPITVDMTKGYLIYVYLGVLLNDNQPPKWARFLIYLSGITGLVIHIAGTYQLSVEAGKIVETYKGYTNIPCILYSTAVFIAVKQIAQKIQAQSVWRMINRLGAYTLPIYLLQWFAFDLVKRYFNIDTFSLKYRLGIPFLIIPMIIFFTWGIRKIPVLRKILP